MKITLKELKLLIENFLKESPEEPSEKELETTSKRLTGTSGEFMTDEKRDAETEKFYRKKIKNIPFEKILYMIEDPNARLEFNGYSLKWMSGNEMIHEWYAMSGAPKTGKDSHNHDPNEKQSQPGGPTPEGRYQIGFPEIKKTDGKAFLRSIAATLGIGGVKSYNWNVAGSGNSWGMMRYYLYPEGHDALGRTDMYIHGGDEPGSIGCIDLVGNLYQFGIILAGWMVANSLPPDEELSEYDLYKVGRKADRTTPFYLDVDYSDWKDISKRYRSKYAAAGVGAYSREKGIDPELKYIEDEDPEYEHMP